MSGERRSDHRQRATGREPAETDEGARARTDHRATGSKPARQAMGAWSVEDISNIVCKKNTDDQLILGAYSSIVAKKWEPGSKSFFGPN